MKLLDRIARRLGYVPAGTVRVRRFEAVRIDRLKGPPPASVPIGEDLRGALRPLRALARHAAQNNPWMRGFLREVRVNIAGPQGIRLQARVLDPQDRPDPLASQAIEEAWAEWGRAGSCDASGRLSWRDFQRLWIETVARDGEALVRLHRGWDGNGFRFAVELLDPGLLDEELERDLGNGRRIRMGVELDRYGRALAYYLLAATPADADYRWHGRGYVRVPAEDILHGFLPEWVWQHRGIPWIAAGLDRLRMLGGYEEAELVAARTAAAKMGFFVEDPTISGGGMPQDDQDADGAPVVEAEPGTFARLPAGWDFKEWDPSHPNTAYKDFVQACLRGVASGLGVAYNALAHDLEGVSYSSLREAALRERAVWMTVQDWMVDALCEPVYRAWLDMALLAGAIRVRGRPLKASRRDLYRRVFWQPRRWPWVDPLKEAQAAERLLALRVRSPQSVIREQGGDPEQVLDEWVRWREMLAERGIPERAEVQAAGSTAAMDGESQP